jgi:hypothetical protein
MTTIADLRGRLTEADLRLSDLMERRRKVPVLDAINGDAAAREGIDRLDVEIEQVKRQAADLFLAVEQAAAQEAEAARQSAERAADAALATANEIRSKIAAAAKRSDAALAEARAAYQEIDTLARDLQKTGTISSDYLNRILARGAMKQRAVLHAGLRPYLDLDVPTGHGTETLEAAVTRLLAVAIKRPAVAVKQAA